MSLDMQQISWPGWETVGLIGHGNFGAVYEIRRKLGGIEEKAALKVIQIPQSQHDIDEMYSNGYDEEDVTTAFQSHMESILSEYSLMRKMNGHTNIVSCDDIRYVQHDDGIGWDIFIKMELLTPLTKALPADIGEQEAIRVAKDICGALELCSKHNVIHRDIKPQNIFVSEHGDYKLGDFGIAKTVEKTMGGTKIGTYKYMAPEVYNNQPYGHSSDIYSLGLVLYWLLNERRMPFLPLPPAKLKAGMEEEARERRFRGEELPAPAHGSKALQAIVLKACAYDPAQRYHTAAEMLQDLEKLGAKPAMPELVTAAALAPETAPEVVPAPVQKPVPALEPMAKAPAAQKTREQVAEEYRRNYRAQQERVRTGAQQANYANTPKRETVRKNRDVKKTVIALILAVLMLGLYFLNAETFLLRMISGTTLIGWRYPGLRQSAIAFRNVLVRLADISIDTIKGTVFDRFGMALSVSPGENVLLSVCYLILPSMFVLLLPVILGIFFGVRDYRKKRNLQTQLRPAGKWALAGTGILMYALTAEAYLCRIISGNIMLASINEKARENIKAINDVLIKLSGSSRSEYGMVTNRWGNILNCFAGMANEKNALYLIVPAAIMLILPILVGIWIGVQAIRKKKTEKGKVPVVEEAEQ